jgi:selenocysteine lyase/cysteine desulfurase
MSRPNRPIYLDNHATTPVDPRVLAAMRPWWEQNFANPGGLITWIQGQKGAVKLRPDAKLALIRDMDLAERVKRARDLLRVLARLAGDNKHV